MSKPAYPHLPLDGLMRASGCCWATSNGEAGKGSVDAPTTALANLCRVALRVVHRWAAEGLTFYAADQMATRCGMHPSNVWGQAWWDASIEVADIEAALDAGPHRAGKLASIRDRALRREFVRGCDAAENRRARFDRYIEVIEDRMREGVA